MAVTFFSIAHSSCFSLRLLETLPSFFPVLFFCPQVLSNLYLPSYWPVSSLLTNEGNKYCSTAHQHYFIQSVISAVRLASKNLFLSFFPISTTAALIHVLINLLDKGSRDPSETMLRRCVPFPMAHRNTSMSLIQKTIGSLHIPLLGKIR